MRRKYRQLHKKENVIAFPGVYEKFIEEGFRNVEEENYAEAVKLFDQAMYFTPSRVDFLGAYAVALYETKDFQRAKEIASLLLHSNTATQPEMIELYVSICMQLQEYEEVDMLLDAMMESGMISPDLTPKFTYLKSLNERLSDRYPKEELHHQEPLFTFKEVLVASYAKQQQMLSTIDEEQAVVMSEVLVNITESVQFSPVIITFALTLLKQANYPKEVTVQKFGREKTVVPNELDLPGQSSVVKNVKQSLGELLDKNPSSLEMAEGLLEKFNVTAYPFLWGNYEEKEIALAYVEYIECLFSGEPLPDTPLFHWIEKIDKALEFENI